MTCDRRRPGIHDRSPDSRDSRVKRAIGSPLARLHRMSGEERQSVERNLASELAPDPNVVFAYLYGSFVDAQPFHDVDVGVFLQTFRPEVATTVALDWSQRLSGRVRMPVDVRILLTPRHCLVGAPGGRACETVASRHGVRGSRCPSWDEVHILWPLERARCPDKPNYQSLTPAYNPSMAG